ncbi:MAG: formylglycine-generating enzyme family protein [Prevotellaceae bacterium]|nr:formylglycine-generating enzyme family protein [Prevotellaceae bacterium]
MKRIVTLFAVVIFVTSCGNKGGVGGGGSRRGFEAPPENMTLIPRGSFEMGSNDEDFLWTMNNRLKRITVDQFYMDLTETTNSAYRAFVYWTADSIARRILAMADVEDFAKAENEDEEESEDMEEVPLNYRTAIHLSPKQRNYSDHYEPLKSANFFYSKQEGLGQKRAIDVRKLRYKYKYYDLQQAAKARWEVDDQNPEGHYVGTVKNQNGEIVEIQDRSSFIIEESVPVYPDTLVWIRDLSYSYNEPHAKSYFWHPGFDNYPVVGVSWKQASAFCHWRSYHAKEKRYRNQYPSQEYRLPIEAEYEYAARGGLEGGLYPWGSMYNTNSKGCYLANFKPQRGDYALDGFARTSAVAQYEPNEFGLYDMAGNVAEWVNDAYEEGAYNYTHDLVPTYHQHVTKKDKASKRRKVVRGGSWKDISYFLQTGARDYNYMDSAHSYIGFRTVKDAAIGINSRVR